MFEAAEVGHTLTESEFRQREAELRTRCILAQFALRSAPFPVMMVIDGDDRPGCDALVHRLNGWFDPRFIETNAFASPSDEASARPRFWRYWRALPPHGRIGLFLGAWPWQLLKERVLGDLNEVTFMRWLEHVRRFEETLTAEGAVLLKYWLHVPRKTLRRRVRAARKHPEQYWVIDRQDRRALHRYADLVRHAETMIQQTNMGTAPWQIVESTDERYRDMTVIESNLDALERRLSRPATDLAPGPAKNHQDSHTILDTIDLTRRESKKDYETQLPELQAHLRRLIYKAYKKEMASVVVFEGMDAAGKGGAIRRVAAALPSQVYRIVPVAAPTSEERSHHYLWRFWRDLPRAGHMVIFDRSWYGRVLVERVEGFASVEQYQRAYSEINDFEQQLLERGTVLVKIWLQISLDEQLARFRKREQTPFKQFKITPDDWRNRERHADYEVAVEDMVARTSTSSAPWTLIGANDKRYARLEVLRTLIRAFETACETR